MAGTVERDDARQPAAGRQRRTTVSARKAALGLAAWEYDKAVRGGCGVLLCGVDEAGRGPLAGPVVAAAVILPVGLDDVFIYDSKQMTERQRETAYAAICERATASGVGVVDPEYIDQYNILQATYEAMRRAIHSLAASPPLILVDGVVIPGLAYPQRRLVRGDSVSQSIAAASILAKVTRDAMMRELDRMYPAYGFGRNMGYGTEEHLAALALHGPCPAHRQSFAPVRAKPDSEAAQPRDVRKLHGIRAEHEALSYLETLGYSLLERNWRCAFGEIDLVVVKDDVLAFVEVRSRMAQQVEEAVGAAAESVDANKRRRLRRLAEWFIAERRLQWAGTFRFDAVLVGRNPRGERMIEHVTQAW